VRLGGPGRVFGLTEDPLRSERRGYPGTQHLDRHRASVLRVPREIPRCHPAAPQLTLERVAVGELRAETIERWGGHPRPTRFSSAPKRGSSELPQDGTRLRPPPRPRLDPHLGEQRPPALRRPPAPPAR